VLVSATACGGEEEEEEAAGGTTTVGGQEANDHGTEDAAGEDSIEFEMDDFYFEPTVLEGEAGQTLTLEAFNEGDEEHNVTIEDQGIDEDIEPDDEGEVEVTFPDSGTVVFFCKYHQDQGMRGALRVAS
jgi:plastocyanin